MAVTLETVARNAACNAVVELVDAGEAAGVLEIKTSAGTSALGNGEVATLTFADPAFGAAATGVATAGTITADSSAVGGTAAKAYFYDSDETPILSCSVGTAATDIVLSSVTVNEGDTVSVSSLTVTMPATVS